MAIGLLTVVAYGPVSDAFIRSPDDELRREAARLPGTSSPRLSIVASPLALSNGGAQKEVVPVTVARFEDHLEGVQGSGDGLWIDRATANVLGVSVGGWCHT